MRTLQVIKQRRHPNSYVGRGTETAPQTSGLAGKSYGWVLQNMHWQAYAVGRALQGAVRRNVAWAGAMGKPYGMQTGAAEWRWYGGQALWSTRIPMLTQWLLWRKSNRGQNNQLPPAGFPLAFLWEAGQNRMTTGYCNHNNYKLIAKYPNSNQITIRMR